MADGGWISALRGRWHCTDRVGLRAYFGIPLLALVGRPWWVATRSVQGHRRLGSTALGHTIVALAAFTVVLAISVLNGLDDLDTLIDAIGLTAAVGWLTMCWFATAERVHA
jgi:hypothetical protein